MVKSQLDCYLENENFKADLCKHKLQCNDKSDIKIKNNAYYIYFKNILSNIFLRIVVTLLLIFIDLLSASMYLWHFYSWQSLLLLSEVLDIHLMNQLPKFNIQKNRYVYYILSISLLAVPALNFHKLSIWFNATVLFWLINFMGLCIIPYIIAYCYSHILQTLLCEIKTLRIQIKSIVSMLTSVQSSSLSIHISHPSTPYSVNNEITRDGIKSNNNTYKETLNNHNKISKNDKCNITKIINSDNSNVFECSAIRKSLFYGLLKLQESLHIIKNNYSNQIILFTKSSFLNKNAIDDLFLDSVQLNNNKINMIPSCKNLSNLGHELLIQQSTHLIYYYIKIVWDVEAYIQIRDNLLKLYTSSRIFLYDTYKQNNFIKTKNNINCKENNISNIDDKLLHIEMDVSGLSIYIHDNNFLKSLNLRPLDSYTFIHQHFNSIFIELFKCFLCIIFLVWNMIVTIYSLIELRKIMYEFKLVIEHCYKINIESSFVSTPISIPLVNTNFNNQTTNNITNDTTNDITNDIIHDINNSKTIKENIDIMNTTLPINKIIKLNNLSTNTNTNYSNNTNNILNKYEEILSKKSIILSKLYFDIRIHLQQARKKYQNIINKIWFCEQLLSNPSIISFVSKLSAGLSPIHINKNNIRNNNNNNNNNSNVKNIYHENVMINLLYETEYQITIKQILLVLQILNVDINQFAQLSLQNTNNFTDNFYSNCNNNSHCNDAVKSLLLELPTSYDFFNLLNKLIHMKISIHQLYDIQNINNYIYENNNKSQIKHENNNINNNNDYYSNDSSLDHMNSDNNNTSKSQFNNINIDHNENSFNNINSTNIFTNYNDMNEGTNNISDININQQNNQLSDMAITDVYIGIIPKNIPDISPIKNSYLNNNNETNDISNNINEYEIKRQQIKILEKKFMIELNSRIDARAMKIIERIKHNDVTVTVNDITVTVNSDTPFQNCITTSTSDFSVSTFSSCSNTDNHICNDKSNSSNIKINVDSDCINNSMSTMFSTQLNILKTNQIKTTNSEEFINSNITIFPKIELCENDLNSILKLRNRNEVALGDNSDDENSIYHIS